MLLKLIFLIILINLQLFELYNCYPVNTRGNYRRTDRRRGSASSSRASSNPGGPRCDVPDLKNGFIKIRQNGKLIKFQCNRNFKLYGNQYSGCEKGKWDSTVPVCARSGCQPFTTPQNGFVVYEENMALAQLFCSDKYQVAGVKKTYCNGTDWDIPLGICRETGIVSQLYCDFESDDLCGWEHDYDNHDFNWKRTLSSDTYRRSRTGPQFDHTTLKVNQGHYMLIETTQEQQPDYVARLISPVYKANLSVNSCFTFWYHMYGASVGSLRVYVKPMNIDMDKMLEQPNYLYFIKMGNQKNQWHENTINLEDMDVDFQIVIEGTAGKGHLSDIAIDDVSLNVNSSCVEEYSTTGQYDYTSTLVNGLGVYDIKSCLNRCNETQSLTLMDFQTNNSTENTEDGVVKNCDCHPECEDAQTCCLDYRRVCAFANTEEPYSLGDTDAVEDMGYSNTVSEFLETTQAVNNQDLIGTVQNTSEDGQNFESFFTSTTLVAIPNTTTTTTTTKSTTKTPITTPTTTKTTITVPTTIKTTTVKTTIRTPNTTTTTIKPTIATSKPTTSKSTALIKANVTITKLTAKTVPRYTPTAIQNNYPKKRTTKLRTTTRRIPLTTKQQRTTKSRTIAPNRSKSNNNKYYYYETAIGVQQQYDTTSSGVSTIEWVYDNVDDNERKQIPIIILFIFSGIFILILLFSIQYLVKFYREKRIIKYKKNSQKKNSLEKCYVKVTKKSNSKNDNKNLIDTNMNEDFNEIEFVTVGSKIPSEVTFDDEHLDFTLKECNNVHNDNVDPEQSTLVNSNLSSTKIAQDVGDDNDGNSECMNSNQTNSENKASKFKLFSVRKIKNKSHKNGSLLLLNNEDDDSDL